jgi:hypothetical protein
VSAEQSFNADDSARILRRMSELANSLERQACEQLRKAREFPAGSSLRNLKEKYARELFQEVKRLRVKNR